MAKNLLMYSALVVLGVLVWLDRAQKDGAPAETVMQAPPIEGGRAIAVATPRELVNPLSKFEKSELKDTIERPLFASARKRPPAVADDRATIAQAEAKPAPPSYDLLGVVRDGERSIALIRDKKDGTSFRVEVGDMIGGWHVAKLAPKSILLRRDDGTSQSVPLF